MRLIGRIGILRGKFMLSLLMFSLLPMVLIIIVNKTVLIPMLEEQIANVNAQGRENIRASVFDSIQTQLDAVLSAANNPVVGDALQRIAHKTSLTTTEYVETLHTIFNEVVTQQPNHSYAHPYHYVVITPGHQIFSSFPNTRGRDYSALIADVELDDVYRSLERVRMRNMRIFKRAHMVLPSEREQLYIAVNIVSKAENVGVLFWGVDISYYQELLNRPVLDDSACIALMTNNGQPVAQSRNGAVSPETFFRTGSEQQKSSLRVEGELYDVEVYKMFNNMNEQIVRLYIGLPHRNVVKSIDYLNNIILAMILITIMLSFACMLILNGSVIKPVLEIHRVVGQVSEGRLDVRSGVSSRDEIGLLGEGVNEMIDRIKDQMETIRVVEAQRHQAEFSTLLAQIKPHFVRNTLNTIRWMAQLRGMEGVGRSIQSFSNMLDYNFRDSSMTSLVSEEISYVKEYLSLQALRYQDIFSYSFEIDPAVLDCVVPKLLLQPIVENSIHHGILPRKNVGEILITGQRENDQLVFRVIDDGVGMAQAQVDALLNELPEPSGVGRIALYNIDRRIQLYYGQLYGLRIESELSRGTTVEIFLPILRMEAK